MSFIPFSFGSSESSSFNNVDQSARSFVDPGQAPFLDFLRNTAASSFPGFQQGAQQLGEVGQQLFGQGQALAPGFTNNQFLDALGQQAGGNPDLVAAQTQQLGSDIGSFFREELLPGLRQGGIQSGQLGQGRQQVGQGIAAGKAFDAFSRGQVDIQAADAARSQQAALGGAQQFGQGTQGQANFLNQQFALQQGAFQSQFAPLQQLQQLIGPTTVLDESQTTQRQGSESSEFNFGVG